MTKNEEKKYLHLMQKMERKGLSDKEVFEMACLEEKIYSCNRCKKPGSCCRLGAYVDVEEAKKIVSSGAKGNFYGLEIDRDFPSGFCLSTCLEGSPCSFLTSDGLCSVHKISYDLKPSYCKQYPYEDGKLSPFARLCYQVIK